MTCERHNSECSIGQAYISGKLSCINREIIATEQYLRTLKREKHSLMRTLEDRTQLAKIKVRKVRRKSVVEVTVDVSSGGEYYEDDDKKEIKPLPVPPISTPHQEIEQID